MYVTLHIYNDYTDKRCWVYVDFLGRSWEEVVRIFVFKEENQMKHGCGVLFHFLSFQRGFKTPSLLLL